MSPPTASNASAMSRALRCFVPLKSRCSRKWLDPLIGGGSSREPASTQKPSDTERTPGIRSVTTRRPEESSVRSIPMSASGRGRLLGRAPLAPLLAPVHLAFRHVPLGPDRLEADLALGVDVLDQDRQPVAFPDGLLDG